MQTRTPLLLFLAVFLLGLAGTWSIPLIDRDEPRFAEASREMRQRGDYVVPYFNGKVRYDKPALIYWVQTASYRIFGENELAARFPSVLALAGTSVLLLLFGTRVGGEKLGLLAGAIFPLCPVVMYIGKAATADMVMVFWVTLAAWAGWELVVSQRFRWGWWTLFYVALGLGFLTKGPVAWLPLGWTLAAAGMAKKPGTFRRLGWLPGIILMLAVSCAWGVPAQIATHGEFFRIGIGKHVVQRAVDPLEGHGANGALTYFLWLPFHFVGVFVFFLPWAIFLPAAWKWFWREGKLDGLNRYLAIAVASTFLLFSFYTTKLPHYTLPAYPVLALLLARWMMAAEVPIARLRKLTVATATLFLAVLLVVPPLIAPFFPAKQLYLATRSMLKPHMEWASVDFTEGSLIWYYRTVVDGYHRSIGMKAVADFMKDEGARFVIIPTQKLEAALPTLDPAWKIVRVKGFNLPKGKNVDLTLVLKE